MPLAHVRVIEGVFTEDEKRKMIQRVTDALVSVEGETLKDKTYVLIEEVKSGSWGIGGRPLTADDVQSMRHAR
jgi:4-oxalocrotonate tautomerase